MHLFGTIGFVLLFIGILINLYLLVLKIMGGGYMGQALIDTLSHHITWRHTTNKLICIIAEINIRTYYESGNKKTYQVRKIWSK